MAGYTKGFNAKYFEIACLVPFRYIGTTVQVIISTQQIYMKLAQAHQEPWESMVIEVKEYLAIVIQPIVWEQFPCTVTGKQTEVIISTQPVFTKLEQQSTDELVDMDTRARALHVMFTKNEISLDFIFRYFICAFKRLVF